MELLKKLYAQGRGADGENGVNKALNRQLNQVRLVTLKPRRMFCTAVIGSNLGVNLCFYFRESVRSRLSSCNPMDNEM